MAKTEETEGKDVKKAAGKVSEEDALRERIGGAKEGGEAATGSEGISKAEKYKAFLKENDINFFDSDTLADEYDTL